jgi:hypothetical protein
MKPQDYQLPQSKVIPPEAVCIEVYTERNTETEVAFRADSWSPRPLHYEIIAEPAHGVLLDQDGFEITTYPVQVTGESIRYSPNMHFTGRDIFSYRVIGSTDIAWSKSAVVAICVFDAHRADEVYLPIFELNMEKILKHEFQKLEVDKRVTWEIIEEVSLV